MIALRGKELDKINLHRNLDRRFLTKKIENCKFDNKLAIFSFQGQKLCSLLLSFIILFLSLHVYIFCFPLLHQQLCISFSPPCVILYH